MFNGMLGVLVAVLALLGAGIISFTNLENVFGPRESAPATVETPRTITPTIAPVDQSPVTVRKTPPKTLPKTTIAKQAPAVTPVAATEQKKVVAPGPLRASTPASGTSAGVLTVKGVIEYTNIARAQNGGLPALVENTTLDRDAETKLADMFAKQYFEHVSPLGVGPGDLAKTVGYAYIIVGENLALGDFGSDDGVVTAWMNSPGHRANILNAHYQEIGVAVGKGMYEGRMTWLAVQSFGMPLSACPAIDAGMKIQIDTNNTQIAAMKADLDAKKAKIDSTPQTDPNYNTYVNDYNILVTPYNNAVQNNKALVETYNAQVNAYNNCLAVAGTGTPTTH